MINRFSCSPLSPDKHSNIRKQFAPQSIVVEDFIFSIQIVSQEGNPITHLLDEKDYFCGRVESIMKDRDLVDLRIEYDSNLVD
jgi:hypothetical protein